MPNFKKPVADARTKIAKAEADAFVARLEALDAILDGAKPSDIMLLAAHALAHAAPLCCDQHQDEFKADFLRKLADCIAAEERAEDAAEAEADGDAPPQVHCFYWTVIGQSPPEVAYWARGEWWPTGETTPWRPEAVTVVSERLVFKPKLAPVA
jgi:hypothetical protein